MMNGRYYDKENPPILYAKQICLLR